MKTLVSALILSASFIGAAQAGELDYPPALNTQSTVTAPKCSKNWPPPAPTVNWYLAKKATPPPRSLRPALTRPAPK